MQSRNMSLTQSRQYCLLVAQSFAINTELILNDSNCDFL